MPDHETAKMLRLFAQGLNINEIAEKFPSFDHDKVRDLLEGLINDLEETIPVKEGSSELTVHIDGACRGNPGPGSLGIVILDKKGKIVEEIKEKIGMCTNNVAEYKALIRALERCSQLTKTEVLIKSDSQLLVRQLSGVYKIKDEKIKLLNQKVQELKKKFSDVKFIHIPRSENAAADALANEALDGK